MVTAKAPLTVSLSLPDDVLEYLRVRAVQQKRTTEELVVEYLTNAVADDGLDPELLADLDEGLRDLEEGRTVDGDQVEKGLMERVAASRAAWQAR